MALEGRKPRVHRRSVKLLANKPWTSINNFGIVFVKFEASEEEVVAQVDALHISNWFPYGTDLVVEVFVTKRLTERFDNESGSPRSMDSLFFLFGEKDDWTVVLRVIFYIGEVLFIRKGLMGVGWVPFSFWVGDNIFVRMERSWREERAWASFVFLSTTL